MILRDYQERLIGGIHDAYRRGQRAVLAQSPVGSGKTVVAAAIIALSVARGRRVLFGAHRIELLDQARRKLADAGVVDVRLIRAGAAEGPESAPVTIASIQTLAGRRWRDRLPSADRVILDEAHHSACDSWLAIAERYREALLLGITATPERGDGVALGHVFDALVTGPTVRELTDLGHLVPLRTWAPRELTDPGKLAMSPLEAYRRHCGERLAIVFASRVADAERFAEEMTGGGVPAACVHGQLTDEARADLLARFARGDLRAVTTVDVLTEGTDIPPASACILACAPRFPGRLIQMAGRVVRTHPGKSDAVLVDLCGSVLVHGTLDMAREYSLTGRGIRTAPELSIRQCGACGGVFEAGPAVCPMCGAAVVVKERKAPRSSGVGVEEVGDLTAQRGARLRANLTAVAARRGYGQEWIERAVTEIGKRRMMWR